MRTVDAILEIAKVLSAIKTIEHIKITIDEGRVTAEALDGNLDTAALYMGRVSGDQLKKLPTAVCYGEMSEKVFDAPDGVLGLRNIEILKNMVAASVGMSVTLERDPGNSVGMPCKIRFDNSQEQVMEYRLGSMAFIGPIVSIPPLKELEYDVVVAVTGSSIKLFKHFADQARKKNLQWFWPMMNRRGKLYLSFDEDEPHAGTDRFEFASNVPYVNMAPYSYPAEPVLQVLALFESVVSIRLSFSNIGSLRIDVATMLGKYRFYVGGSDSLIRRWQRETDWPQVLGIERMIQDDKCMSGDWEPDLS